MSGNHRTVIYDPVCYEQLREIVPDSQQLDAMMQGVEFVLATLPWTQLYIGGPGEVWATDCAIPGTDQSVALYFTFNANEVTLHRALLRANNL